MNNPPAPPDPPPKRIIDESIRLSDLLLFKRIMYRRWGMDIDELSQRRKIFYIEERFILKLINLWKADHEEVIIPKIKDLPEDAHIISTFFEPKINGFGFVILSKSFDPVKEGMEAPRIRAEWEIIKFKRDFS